MHQPDLPAPSGDRGEALFLNRAAAVARLSTGAGPGPLLSYRMIARQYLFAGRVQGVGFRYATKQLAKGFDVLGWVRNLPDGSVELQVMGEEDELDDFIQELHDSPIGRHIQEQTERRVPLLEDVSGFTIRE